MLTETVCNRVLHSEVWKLWTATTIVKMQVENAFQLVPEDLFYAASRQTFKINDTVKEEDFPGIIENGTIGRMYMQHFGGDRPSLKWVIAQIPKNCAYSIVKRT